jgi:hypothetical protein
MDASPQGSSDLFFCRPGTDRIERLRGYTGIEPPVLHEDRFYWLSELPEASAVGAVRYPVGTLVSARLDGSEEREVLSSGLATDASPRHRLLTIHRGWLYLTELRPVSERPGASSALALALCRIRPEHSNAVERLIQLPFESAGYCFDGDSFYFTASTQQETWLDWSTQGLNVRTDQFLYRYRLPQ